MPVPVHILIVEDSKFLNNALSAMLLEKASFKCRIHQAFTLHEAEEIVANEPINFVILDLILPDGRGEYLLRSLSSRPEIKTIVMTSQKGIQRREFLFKEGIIDYFSKDNPLPYLSREILHLIDNIRLNHTKTIMIIDDSATVRMFLENIFVKRDYRVISVADAHEALELLLIKRPSLILLDLEMPKIRGDAMLRKLKEAEQWVDIPVIIITGSADEETKRIMLKHGAHDILEKPFSTEVIITKAEQAIAINESKTQLKKLSSSLGYEVNQMSLEIKQKQELINNQMRQVAMGEMLNAIIHQWMQPLSMISLISEDLVHKGLESPLSAAELKDFETKIDDYIDYMKEVSESFKNFFKPLHYPSPFSIIGSIREILALLETRYANLTVSIQGDESISVEGYKNEFQQVIVNLLDNAKEATLQSPLPPRVEIVLSSSGPLVLTLKDNGSGIDPKIKRTLFTPYMTTKRNGNGIGLHLSRKILEKIGASIDAENDESGGAKFTISF